MGIFNASAGKEAMNKIGRILEPYKEVREKEGKPFDRFPIEKEHENYIRTKNKNVD